MHIRWPLCSACGNDLKHEVVVTLNIQHIQFWLLSFVFDNVPTTFSVNVRNSISSSDSTVFSTQHWMKRLNLQFLELIYSVVAVFLTLYTSDISDFIHPHTLACISSKQTVNTLFLFLSTFLHLFCNLKLGVFLPFPNSDERLSTLHKSRFSFQSCCLTWCVFATISSFVWLRMEFDV